jgi:hypothetical protein
MPSKAKTGGRLGSVKLAMSLRDDIMKAYEEAGGVEYLISMAHTDPRTFVGLLHKVLPTQIAGMKDEPLKLELSEMTDDQLSLKVAEIMGACKKQGILGDVIEAEVVTE